MIPCSHSPSELMDILEILRFHHRVKNRCLKCGKVFERWERIE